MKSGIVPRSIKCRQMGTDIQDQILRLRAKVRLIRSEKFFTLYKGSSYESQEEIECVIYKGDLSELQSWMKNHPKLTMEDLNIRQLHAQARKKRIKNYGSLSKCELIRMLAIANYS